MVGFMAGIVLYGITLSPVLEFVTNLRIRLFAVSASIPLYLYSVSLCNRPPTLSVFSFTLQSIVLGITLSLVLECVTNLRTRLFPVSAGLPL